VPPSAGPPRNNEGRDAGRNYIPRLAGTLARGEVFADFALAGSFAAFFLLVGPLAFLAAALASRRACRANFLACLRVLRASLSLAFASRARFRAAATSSSASTALPASNRALVAMVSLVFCFAFFIASSPSEASAAGGRRPTPRPKTVQTACGTPMADCKRLIVTICRAAKVPLPNLRAKLSQRPGHGVRAPPL